MRWLFLALLFVCCTASAADFTGDWLVVKLVPSKEFPWHEEIKYPESFSLRVDGLKLVGSYKDQTGYECDFELIEIINDGHELILGHCGGTKHASSWAPIHKVKMVDGLLHGIVVTSEKRFEWIAEKAH